MPTLFETRKIKILHIGCHETNMQNLDPIIFMRYFNISKVSLILLDASFPTDIRNPQKVLFLDALKISENRLFTIMQIHTFWCQKLMGKHDTTFQEFLHH